MDDVTKRAIDSYQKDARFHALALSIAAQSLDEHGPIDPERAEREVRSIALHMAVVLMQRVFEEDRELAAMRMERDHYKELAEKTLRYAPIPPTFVSAPS